MLRDQVSPGTANIHMHHVAHCLSSNSLVSVQYVLHCLSQAQTLVTVSVRQDVVCSTVVALLLPTTDMSTLIEIFNLSTQFSMKFMQK